MPSEQRPEDVLVEVDGSQLTRADAEKEISERLKAAARQLPPDRVQTMRPRMMAYVLDQFVIRTVLMHEAKRAGIKVSDEDIDKELAIIAEQLPPGVTIEQVMKESSAGEEHMRGEVVTKLTIDKLLATRPDAAPAEIAEDDVDAFYEKHGDRLLLPENVHARHILITTAEEDDESARAAKREKAADLRQQLVDGADFKELAEANSDCPSKKMGGDLGRFKRGQMVPPFEEAAFSRKPGEIGPVVETKFGYHVIEVLEHTEASRVPREKVIQMMKADRQREKMAALVQELKDKSKITFAPGTPRLMPPPVAPQGEAAQGAAE